jgi:hypothetical protein
VALLPPREIPMPQQILDLRREAFSYVSSDPGWRFLSKSDECTVFRTAVKSGDIIDAEEIISTGLKLHNDIAKYSTVLHLARCMRLCTQTMTALSFSVGLMIYIMIIESPRPGMGNAASG